MVFFASKISVLKKSHAREDLLWVESKGKVNKNILEIILQVLVR